MAKGKKTGGGSRKGIQNKRSQGIGDYAKQLLESEEYRATFVRRLRDGTLPPAVETMLYYYAYGKPIDRVEHSGSIGLRPEDLDTMSDAQLLAILAARHAPSNGYAVETEA